MNHSLGFRPRLLATAAAVIGSLMAPLGKAQHWDAFKKDACSGLGLHQYSAKLLSIPAGTRWEDACEATGATIEGQSFARPTRCKNKGVFGMWGEFDVTDASCSASWGEPVQRDACLRMGVRQYSSRLWNIPPGVSWEDACAGTAATIQGQTFARPTRCVNKGAFGMWGEFDVADTSCPYWGTAFQRDDCVGSGLRQYSARLWDIPPGVTWEDACAATHATVEGRFFGAPSRCRNRGAAGMWGEFDVPDTTCYQARWGAFQDDNCTRFGVRQYSSRLWDIPAGITWESACAATPANVAGHPFPSPSRCINKGLAGMWGEFDVLDPLCRGGSVTRPFRGSIAWSVLLCVFSDSTVPPRDADFFRNMFLRRGTGGLADYFQAVSYGSVNLDASVVQGWYTQPRTISEARARNRNEKFQDCIEAARNASINPHSVPPNHLVAVITFPDMDMFGVNGGGAFLPPHIDLGGMGHEVSHGLGLNHSFSDDPNYRNATWSAIGEYDDPWDLMSWRNVFGTPTASFGTGGPGLNAYHRDRMGWLPRSRILTIGADGEGERTVTLAALDHPEATGMLLVRVPFDPADVFHYYTVEFRRNDGWDAGIPPSTVLIHEIKDIGGGDYRSFLLRKHEAWKPPVQSLNANGVRISVDYVSPATNQATITVRTDIVNRCVPGFVWRDAGPSDRVCVTPDTRRQTRDDNAEAASRRVSGGDTCVQGYVWREAFPGDRVCVTPQTRSQAASDNSQAQNRRNPARLVQGPNACKAGFVWRDADERDWVCVAPEVRQQTADDNAQARSRRTAGGDTCLQGYVWREAFPDDRVCVTPQARSQASSDNRQATSRLLKP